MTIGSKEQGVINSWPLRLVQHHKFVHDRQLHRLWPCFVKIELHTQGEESWLIGTLDIEHQTVH